MTNKTKLLLMLSAVLLAYATGRYLQPAKVVTKNVEVVKEVTKRDVRTVIKTVKLPDGTVTRERTTEDKTQVNNETNKSNTTEITAQTSKTHISAMAGWDFNEPNYGVAITKDIWGPVNVGVWMFVNGPAGLSVGISF